MRRLATLCLLVPLLGCRSPSYDQEALHDAALNLHQDVFACETKRVTNAVKSFSEFTACQVAAERNFATAIHLKNLDAFETYAAQMMKLAAERDANHPPPEEVRKRAAAIRTDYLAACDCNLKARRTYSPSIDVAFSGTSDILPSPSPPSGSAPSWSSPSP